MSRAFFTPQRLVACAVPCVALLAALAAAAAPDRQRTEADLRSVTERIERVQRQVQQDAVEKNRLNKDLRSAEQSVARARGGLTELRSQRDERNAARRKLVADRTAREAERRRTEEDLAKQVRAAYFMGSNEPIKMLLNQRNPAEFTRNLTYYGYFGRLRAAQIGDIAASIAAIDDLTARIDAEDAELARLEQRQKAQVGELESARRQRGQVLASLEKESQSRAAQLARLQKQQQQLDTLLRQLSRATEAVPFDPNAPFAQLRGKLAWPVAGRIDVDFGGLRPGGLRSDGIEIDAERGSNVRAVHEGRVVYSDWLPGRGLLIILDHGNGYLSLYGHNEQLFRPVGTRVQAGETIASAGDSGGRRRAGVYFEIRRAGKPVDPRGWFRSKAPPAS
ncbi:MAG: peptidoglycan DD-metalloendopeptidase family protein [Steroidobacteraceae bacterium]